MALDEYTDAPKVELHLHLEGAIPLDTLVDLVRQYGGEPAMPDAEELVSRLTYRDFPHFIDVWQWMTQFVRTPADFALIAEAVARSLAAQNIVYAEASISPTDFSRHGLSVQDIALAVRGGLANVSGTRVTLNVDLVRDTGVETMERTLDETLAVADEAGIGGITIGGSEQAHPPGQFAAVYDRARAGGLHLTAHAGEAAGPASVWSAIRDLGVERVGHGIRSTEDPDLVAYLVEHQLPLEVCPTSNVRTGVAPEWTSHPVHALLEAGANVTISTDDPTFFQCDLAGEFRRLSLTSPRTMESLTLAAIDASWLPDEDKTRLRTRVEDWWANSGVASAR